MFKKWKLKIFEVEKREEFIKMINDFYKNHRVRSNKFQRNLYYPPGSKELIASYVAFIIYK
jgi:hypothetical protein